MKKLILKSCTALALIMGGASQVALANDIPQAVRHDIHTCGSMGYGNCGSSTYQGAVIHIPNQEWINYYGALAWNDEGARGVSQNARSERAAKREALKKCGAKDCRIAASTTNGCLASANGNNSTTVGAAPTKAGAEQRAMNHCQANGDTTCQITYSHCNHPVRIK